MLWRQGDLYIAETDSVPDRAIERPAGKPGYDVLADGEATGHRHRIENPRAAMLLDDRGQLYLIVVAPQVRIVHDEHSPIELARGTYRVWRQREYDPAQRTYSRLVLD
jgi:hypothetical protein